MRISNLTSTPLKCPGCDNTNSLEMVVFTPQWLIAGTLEQATDIKPEDPDESDDCHCLAEVNDALNPICNFRGPLRMFVDYANGIEVSDADYRAQLRDSEAPAPPES